MSTVSLFIDKTWCGQPLPESSRIRVKLDLDNVALHIEVDAPYHGDPPPPGPAGATWELWNYEVVEVFIAGPGDRYTEIELGPHGHHLGLRLNGVRNIDQADLPLASRTVMGDQRWHGTVSVPVEHLPPPPWKFNATAICGTGPNRQYSTAFTLSGTQPDFHRLQDFAPLNLSFGDQRNAHQVSRYAP